MNVDHANDPAFIPEKAPVKQSNLCCEINLSIKSYKTLMILKVKLHYVH